MKNTILLILTGLIPVFLLVFGIAIKYAGYDNGNMYIWLSCICFPPAAACIVSRLKIKPEKVRKMAYNWGVISSGYMAFAFIFKGLRLPGGDYFIVAGVTFFAIFFLPFLFRILFLKE